MIPSEAVVTAYVTALGTLLPDYDIGDGEADRRGGNDDRAYAWVTPQPASTGRRDLDGERHRVLIIRVSCAADDGGKGGRAARRMATALADHIRAAMLFGYVPSGDGWRVTGVEHESTAPLAGNGAFVVHDDYRVTVGASGAA